MTESKATVRRAHVKDIAAIVELRRRSYEGGRLEDVVGPFNQAHFEEVFLAGLSSPGDVWLFVAENDEGIIGASFGATSPVWLVPDCYSAAELFVWVEPAHRRKGIGQALLGAVESWAREHGCKFVATFSYPGLLPEAKSAMCAARGYQIAETCHLRRI